MFYSVNIVLNYRRREEPGAVNDKGRPLGGILPERPPSTELRVPYSAVVTVMRSSSPRVSSSRTAYTPKL